MYRRADILKLAAACLFTLGAAPLLLPSRGLSARAASGTADTFQPLLPKGIPSRLWRKMVPADNPMTAEKVALGESLYFDKRLSSDGTLSCATCHDPASAFADSNPTAVGVGGANGTRNAPTVLNAMFGGALFWDGRASSLEEQVKQPLVNPAEMGMLNDGAVVARVSAVAEYRESFRSVFGGEGITIETIAKAIAAYERTRLSGDSPFDRFIAGDPEALTAAQKRGWDLFQHKARCITCHAYSADSPFFTDFKFHNTGVATKGNDPEQMARLIKRADLARRDETSHGTLSHAEGLSDLGRYLVTRRPQDAGAFKTPTLRDVELTTPYMHDGSVGTLLDVVRFYNGGGAANKYLDERMRPLGLTDSEMSDLVEFMRALTSDDVLRQAQTARPQTRTPVPVNEDRRIR